MKKIIKINQLSGLPKYRQIIDSLCNAAESGMLKVGEKIPSINQVSREYNLSRDTVMYAFNELKSRGIIYSQPGKGYYLATKEIFRGEKIFMLFDEFNAFKEDLYNSLIESVMGRAHVEIFFHHFNIKTFRNLIQDSNGRFTSYIIMPASFENTAPVLSKLPPDKVFILDRLKPDLKKYPVVFQDFEKDFYDALVQGLPLLKKYLKLVFIHSTGKEPVERLHAFKRFCNDYNFQHKVVDSIEGNQPGLYEAWFLTSDRDLVTLIKFAHKYKYKLGKKFGIVSFNDTMLKEVVAGGITTVSTDFAEMGKNLADMILNNKKGSVRNSSRMIVRKSL